MSDSHLIVIFDFTKKNKINTKQLIKSSFFEIYPSRNF